LNFEEKSIRTISLTSITISHSIKTTIINNLTKLRIALKIDAIKKIRDFTSILLSILRYYLVILAFALDLIKILE